MMHEMLGDIQRVYENEIDGGKKLNTHTNVLLEGVRSKQYTPLMERVKCGKCFFHVYKYICFY